MSENTHKVINPIVYFLRASLLFYFIKLKLLKLVLLCNNYYGKSRNNS